jgi:comEA protein
MAEKTGTDNQLPGAARWAAVAVLGLAGLAGVIRAWIVAPPRMLEPASASHRSAGPVAPAEPITGADASAARVEAEAPRASVARKVNVNTASAAELDLLPGIGAAYAGRIIADRETNGPFRTLDDLDRVPGIGPKTIAKLAPYASVE